MVKFFLYLILFVIIIALIIWVGAIILALFALLQFIKSLINYVKTKDLQATEMRCPNCGSVDIKINSLQTGAETQSSFSGAGSSTSFNFLGFNTIGSLGGNSHSSTAFTFKREGICQQCGFNYDYLTKEDVTKIKNNNKLALIASSIFLIVVSSFISSFTLQ